MSSSRHLLCALFATGLFAPAQAETRRFDLIALTGRRAPGTAGTFDNLGDPVINNRGHVLFRGHVSGVASVASTGVWLHDGSQIRLQARAGVQAPGAPPGALFVNMFGLGGPYLLNEADQFTLNSGLINAGFSGIERGIWLGAAGDIAPALIPKSPAPGFPAGITVDRIQGHELSNSGDLVIAADLAGSPVVSVIYAGSLNDLRPAVRSGDPAPGLPNEVTFGSLDPVPKIDDNGRILFDATLAGSGVSSANDDSLWFGATGDYHLVAREGDAIPSLAGFRWSNIGRSRINGSGQMLMIADVTGTTPSESGRTLWGGDPHNPRLIARRNDAAPGLSGFAFTDFDNPSLDDRGKIAFRSVLAGEEGPRAIYSGDLEQIHLIALQADQAPDLPPATTFLSLGLPTVNAAGVVAFDARINGPGITTSNDRGIWAGLPGDIRLLLREGDLIEIAPGDARTVQRFTLVPDSSGLFSEYVLNDAGQLRFLVNFTDNSSGIFVAAIPEPTAGVGLALLLLMGMRRWRRL